MDALYSALKSYNGPFFSFEGLKLNVFVSHIYDGDTVHIVFYNNGYYKLHARLDGYDSPEMKPLKTAENRDEIIKSAHAAKNALELLLNRGQYPFMVWAELGKFDKYGRVLLNDNIRRC